MEIMLTEAQIRFINDEAEKLCVSYGFGYVRDKDGLSTATRCGVSVYRIWITKGRGKSYGVKNVTPLEGTRYRNKFLEKELIKIRKP